MVVTPGVGAVAAGYDRPPAGTDDAVSPRVSCIDRMSTTMRGRLAAIGSEPRSWHPGTQIGLGMATGPAAISREISAKGRCNGVGIHGSTSRM
ncbi:hypothetical protein CAE01nite_12740 [Cellulomonas aerilata]|uniref:Uncharacterized protein n=1 Tax=Cellulomonas aerilata TaxID=515326 RepID=A0A512DAQ1_9CELL|nr:hypothetical protein CAE01nite_12740 [Cellulomonas aerilata]